MKKIQCLMLLLALMTACGKEPLMNTLAEPSPDQVLASSEAGLSLDLEKTRYNKSPALIRMELENDSKQDFGYGEYVYIELKQQDDWHLLTHSDAVFINNPDFNDFGYILQAGTKTEMEFSIEGLGIELAPGEYRIVKTFLSQDGPYFEISLASPFRVE